jgi:hypothetical protein
MGRSFGGHSAEKNDGNSETLLSVYLMRGLTS